MKKLFFGMVKVEAHTSPIYYKKLDNVSYPVADYTLIYKFLGIIFHSITIREITPSVMTRIFK